MWIVVNALLLYNIAVKSGRFDAFRAWVIEHLPNDRRVVLVVIGFCFGALLEGIAGFGTPVAITSSLLILVGFPALEALVFVLIFNTAPVAFGALGVPITVLGAVTGLPATALGAMVGRQLPVMALILPFYVMAIYGGMRSVRALWPVLLVAGGSFAASQFVTSNFLDYALTDVLASLGSLIVTLLFLQVWRPAPDPEFRDHAKRALAQDATRQTVAPWQGWLPWLIVSAIVIVWTHFKVGRDWPAEDPVAGPAQCDLDHAVQQQALCRRLGVPAARHRHRDPGGGDHHRAVLVRLSPMAFLDCVAKTFAQVWLAIITVMLIIGLAYLMNYSGPGLHAWSRRVASTGYLFVLLSPFLGWVAVFLSGSDTSGNALFGNLQVVAARQLNLNPDAVRCHQLVRRRDGQDDLAAEHRHRRLGDQPQGP